MAEDGPTAPQTPGHGLSPLPSLHGVTIDREIPLVWDLAGVLAEGETLQKAQGAAGLYAFVIEHGPALYVGKAGGLKPGERVKWANDVKDRLAGHWKTGPFRGLVRTTNARVQVWVMDVKKALGDIWERDIERLESELIGWLQKEDAANIRGNTACDGTSARGFTVRIHRVAGEPLPRITLGVGTSCDSRRGQTPAPGR